jgi:hypothetical protein
VRKVLAKRPVTHEKKGTERTKVTVVCVKGGLKWPSNADILPANSVKLSKGHLPRAIASAAAARITPKACSL